MHQIFNIIELTKLDHTYSRGTKCIDVIAISETLLEYLEGSKLFEIYKITNTDHRECVINMNLE